MIKIQKQELLDAIDELQHDRHTIQTCEKLAAVYVVLDHMYPPEEKSQNEELPIYSRYSGAGGKVGEYGDTEFLRAIAGKNPESTWKLMDEAMSILAITNKRLYEHIMSKI